MGEITSVIAMRPVSFFILLTVAVLLLPSIVIPYWYHMMKNIEHNVEKEAVYSRYLLISKIEDASKLFLPINSSANNVASVLRSTLDDDKLLSFSDIQTKVAPALLEAQSIIPRSTQASYIGLDGLFFSYSMDGNESYAIYSNGSFASHSSTVGYTWYNQLVNSNTGELYGEPKITEPFLVIKETWFEKAMSSPNGYSSLGFRWTSKGREESDLLLNTARVGGKGAISLGFAIEELIDFFSSINLHGASLYVTTLGDNKVLLDGIKEAKIKINGDKALVNGTNIGYVGEIPCKANNDIASGGTTLDIGGAVHIFYCSPINVAGLSSVYVVAFPSKGLVSNVHEHTNVALMLFIVMMVAMVISIFAFVALIVRAARREVHLCAAYMKQMEKTAQAERKSMKQSLAFASANHDVRGYLACIKGLIEHSYHDVSPSSEVASNLKKMEGCAEDLLALVNSILDFSKIEAGKMQLDEGEFNLAQLLEDIADLHYPVAMKKGVDVILDPCDSSVMKFSHVKGDRGKLKQILSNLLSNAVKFTSQGQISIRAWAKKPSLENSIIASNKNSLLNRLSSIFYKNKQAYNDLEEMSTIKQDPNCMEFEFEVEDTGPGIPKDKRESIFENFVQVKENSAGQVGTGLGLGIVQSLVRLMGGDIEIVEKADGERGTCFKFNIFLVVQENTPVASVGQDTVECQDTYPSSGLATCGRSPRVGGSLVVLLIKNDERRRMVKRYMESLGIKVMVVRQGNQLPRALKRIKPKLIVSQYYTSSSGGSDMSPTHGSLGGAYLSSGSDNCFGGPKFLPLSAMDSSSDALPVYRKTSYHRSVKCVMLVIDANAGDFQELCRSVAQFRKDLYRSCTKVVWLERPDTRRAHFSGLDDESLPPTDHIISEPLHGSRLSRVINLLPEFGGELVKVPSRRRRNHQSEIEELDSSSGENPPAKRQNLTFTQNDDIRREISHGEIQEINSPKTLARNTGGSMFGKPLIGKKILVADSNEVTRILSKVMLSNLGASVDLCKNGKEVVENIHKVLEDQVTGSTRLPYDYILIETKMDVMDGCHVTTFIRKEEGKFGIHIPILGLINFPSHEEGQKIAEAGWDSYLTIPFTWDDILEALRSVDKKASVAESESHRRPLAEEVQKVVVGSSSEEPLRGKKFLMAEDAPIPRKLAFSRITSSGGYAHVCENGIEAFELVRNSLSNLASGSEFPYDYILMDCQMPEMDGFEATKRIREEEKKYNIHIPIFALTAHEPGEERRILEVGMDFHLTKPLKIEELLEAMRFSQRTGT